LTTANARCRKNGRWLLPTFVINIEVIPAIIAPTNTMTMIVSISVKPLCIFCADPDFAKLVFAKLLIALLVFAITVIAQSP